MEDTPRHRHSASNGGIQPKPTPSSSPDPSLVLWRQPLATLYHATLECGCLLRQLAGHTWSYRRSVVLLCAAAALVWLVPGPHTALLTAAAPHAYWYGWWVWLGILSSVGLGTGLHTFVLFLGPFIVRVATAARSCHSLDFPAPPYPHEMLCPDQQTYPDGVPLLAMMLKVLPEAFSWGFGTALGELPPYFMARAARLSGRDVDAEVKEAEELVRRQAAGEKLSLGERLKANVEWAVRSAGFLGILVCASVPNPLFDLAGLTCGHCLVPFATFFGATVIGKACFKMSLQTGTVVVVSDEALISRLLEVVERLPVAGPVVRKGVTALLEKQRGGQAGGGNNWLGWLFERFIVCMVLYFAVSIVNALAQSHQQRTPPPPKPRRD